MGLISCYVWRIRCNRETFPDQVVDDHFLDCLCAKSPKRFFNCFVTYNSFSPQANLISSIASHTLLFSNSNPFTRPFPHTLIDATLIERQLPKTSETCSRQRGLFKICMYTQNFGKIHFMKQSISIQITAEEHDLTNWFRVTAKTDDDSLPKSPAHFILSRKNYSKLVQLETV